MQHVAACAFHQNFFAKMNELD